MSRAKRDPEPVPLSPFPGWFVWFLVIGGGLCAFAFGFVHGVAFVLGGAVGWLLGGP